ncbi:MAG: hypothetical protein U9Q33_00115 [Campylobacterota bacterium]|nr:hypothetical protein [Campylobacterota bacterium]
MKEIIEIFKKHRETVENFLTTMIENNSLECSDENNIKAAFARLHSLQTLYSVDENFKQLSASFYPKDNKDETRIGIDKSRYFSNISYNEKSIYMTNPYIHHKTGRSSITIVKKFEDKYVVFDVDLLMMLEELNLIQHNTRFDKINRLVYAIGGYSLSLVAVFLLIYGLFVFITMFFGSSDGGFILNEIFKSIISITLGLAIYDLAKTIIAHEVLFKGIGFESNNQYHILGKFLISIIIALSIESLMVVFKIALDDYTALGYAFYLILGVTIMIIGLGIFHYLTKDKCRIE